MWQNDETRTLKDMGEALKVAVYILNRVSTKVVNKIPYELEKKATISHLHIWGCPIETRPYRLHERKLDSRTISCYFVSYVERSRGYKFYIPMSRSFLKRGNVRFLEEVEFEKEENIRNSSNSQKWIDVMKDEMKSIQDNDIPRDCSQGILRLSQENHISKVLDRFSMKDSKLGDTPIVKGDKFSLKQCPNNDLERNEMQKILYASVVGSLMYAQICTLPNIAFVVEVLDRYLSDPGMQHWKTIKRVMRYLKRTKGYVLTYRKSKGLEIIRYSDSNFVGCQDRKCSMSGYIYMLAGGAISWKMVNGLYIPQGLEEQVLGRPLGSLLSPYSPPLHGLQTRKTTHYNISHTNACLRCGVHLKTLDHCLRDYHMSKLVWARFQLDLGDSSTLQDKAMDSQSQWVYGFARFISKHDIIYVELKRIYKRVPSCVESKNF
ncbi:hypothetical protein CR513_06879, partial [Mucuna pruriens]